MLFAETLRLKDSLPDGVLARLARRQSERKFKPRYAPVAVHPESKLESMLDAGFDDYDRRQLERTIDAIWEDDYGVDDATLYDDYYDYREIEVGEPEDYVEPRFRAKLAGRATDGVNRRRFRRRDVRCWKSLRESQYQ